MLNTKYSSKYLFGFLFTLSLSFVFLVLGMQKVFATDNSSINIPYSYVNIGQPDGLVMLPDGNVWYVDISNFRIVLYNPNTNTIVRTVGRLGSADGEFEEGIRAITVDNDGFLYVLHASCMVYKLDSNGGFMGKYHLRDIDSNCDATTSEGIHYDSYSDSIFITYRDKGIVTKFSKNIVYVSSFGSNGAGDSQFNTPYGVTTDVNGKIYVADSENHRIQVFSPTYTHLLNISTWADIGGTTGFDRLTDIVVLNDGTITATSMTIPSIEQFSSNGTHIRTWSHINDGGIEDVRAPMYLTKDSSDNIYVSDYWIKTLTKYTSTGTFVSSMRNTVLANDKMYFPTDVAYCPSGNMYVVDGTEVNHSRIQEFSNAGSYLNTILTQGETGLEESSTHINCDATGQLWVSGMHEVRVFTKDTTWTLTKTLTVSSGGQLGGIAFSGNDLYIPNLQDTDIMKYTLNEETGNYDYVNSFGGGWDKVGDTRLALPEYLTSPRSVVIDNNGHFFVADWYSLKEFDENGTYVRTLGHGPNYDIDPIVELFPAGFQSSAGVSIDPINHNIYSTDSSSGEVDVFDNVSGLKLRTIGNPGGGTLGGAGQLYFYRPRNSEINPSTGTLTIVDTENSRVQALTTGYRIINLITSANVIVRSGPHTGASLSNEAWQASDFPGTFSAIPARLMFGDYVVADFTVDLSGGDLNWLTVNVQFLPLTSKALVVNLNQTAAPGISDTHSLYVYRYNNQTEVTVCPEALTLSDLYPSCASEFSLTLDSLTFVGEGYTATLSTDTIGGKSYWIIDGLIGTGAFSNLYETSFTLRDLMTRLQVSTGSNHRIEFGTSYDLTHVGDTITITFGSEWDLSGLDVTDLSLIGAGYPMTLSASGPDTDVWGYGRTDNVLTFTAPTGGTAQYIDAGSTIVLIISNAAVINPSTPASYQIDLRLDSDTNPGPADVETGSVNVPIVDSDTVNITGYVTAFMSFDIDTGVANDVDCPSNGCALHGGTDVTASNYTVDLGELKSTYVNASNNAAVMHSDGISGVINSIYFDLSTNAQGGAVVTVKSVNGGLKLMGLGENLIASVENDGDQIDINSGRYGFYPVWTSSGTINLNPDCFDIGACRLVPNPIEVFDTNSEPLDSGRVRMDIAAASTYTNVPGLYEDTLTFVATSTF